MHFLESGITDFEEEIHIPILHNMFPSDNSQCNNFNSDEWHNAALKYTFLFTPYTV